MNSSIAPGMALSTTNLGSQPFKSVSIIHCTLLAFGSPSMGLIIQHPGPLNALKQLQRQMLNVWKIYCYSNLYCL
jgi:hypothetical protein